MTARSLCSAEVSSSGKSVSMVTGTDKDCIVCLFSKEVWAMLPRENFKTKTVSGIHVQE